MFHFLVTVDDRNMRDYEEYYSRQAKGYGLPIYIGGRSRRGNGLGNFLAGIARAVVPMLKRGGKSILNESIRTGAHILQDVAKGKNIQTSANKRAREATSRLVNKAANTLIKEPINKKPIKRPAASKTVQSRTKRGKKTQNREKEDIFDKSI